MKLTNQTTYAIRMLMYCNTKEGLCTVGEIARFYNLPEKFLLKILNILNKKGFVKTVRGRGGGITLGRPAEEMRLGDIVREVEDNFSMAECFDNPGTTCPLQNTCGLNEALGRALGAFFDTLNEYTLVDLTEKRHNINVLLQLHEATKEPLRSAVY